MQEVVLMLVTDVGDKIPLPTSIDPKCSDVNENQPWRTPHRLALFSQLRLN